MGRVVVAITPRCGRVTTRPPTYHPMEKQVVWIIRILSVQALSLRVWVVSKPKCGWSQGK